MQLSILRCVLVMVNWLDHNNFIFRTECPLHRHVADVPFLLAGVSRRAVVAGCAACLYLSFYFY